MITSTAHTSNWKVLIGIPLSSLLLSTTLLAANAEEAVSLEEEYSSTKIGSLISTASLIHSELEQSESRVESTSTKEIDLIQEYSKLLKQLEDRKLYNKELEAKTRNQNALTEILEDSILRIFEIQESIPPLLSKMLTGLQTVVANDFPFAEEIRNENIESAREQLTSDAKISTKLRQVFTLYESELSYGRTIDAYIDAIDIDGEGNTVEVTILRWGRVGMYYQTQDSSRTGMYDNINNKWIELPNSFRNEVRKAIRMARKLESLDLVILPVPAPASAR